jgi:hypothetical protein
MSGFDSYDDFQETVAGYLQRNNLEDQIPWFIELAEIRLNDLFNDFPQQKAAPYTLVPAVGTNVLSLPSDFAMMSEVKYGEHELRFIPMTMLDDRHTRYPAHKFSQDGNNLYLQTVVDGVKTLTMYYFTELDGLSSLNQSNWVLEEYPTIYLYATLVEAAMYMQDDDRLSLFEQRFQQAMQTAVQNKKQKLVPKNTKLIRKRP